MGIVDPAVQVDGIFLTVRDEGVANTPCGSLTSALSVPPSNGCHCPTTYQLFLNKSGSEEKKNGIGARAKGDF